MRRALASAAALAMLAAPPAAARPDTVLRTGNHPGFGRVVFDLSGPVAYVVSREKGRLRVFLPGAGTIPDDARPPRNIAAISGGRDEVTLDLVPGARVREARLGNRLVIDVLDPPHHVARRGVAPHGVVPVSSEPDRSASRPVAPSVILAASAPQPVQVAASPPAKAASPSKSAAAAPLPAEPPASQSPHPVLAATTTPAATVSPGKAAGVVPLRASPPSQPVTAPPHPIPAPPSSPVAATSSKPAAAPPPTPSPPVTARTPPAAPPELALLPAGPDVGAASFRRGDDAVVVLDAPVALDAAALRGNPLLHDATVQRLPAATLLFLKLTPGLALHMARMPAGWTVAEGAAPAPHAFETTAKSGGLLLHTTVASRVVAVPDPLTGATLLVGTESAPAEAIRVARHGVRFAIDPSWQGVVVEPLSDQVTLRTVPQGFALEAGAGGLALSAPPEAVHLAAAATRLTRSWDLPALSAPALMRRLERQMRRAALAPPQARGAPRRAAAQTMVALGMGAEAEALLDLAFADDPHLAEDPGTEALRAVAALLAGRVADADAITAPDLRQTDEIRLWRAVRHALREEHSPQTAAAFAAEMPLLLSYPATLRARLLPLAAETMVLGGEHAAAARLFVRRKDDHSLDFARALLAEATGQTDAALATYDRLAGGRDRRLHARAARRAVELRLATGRINEQQAAEALDRLIPAWRGDDWALRLRLRIAALRAHTGAWRQAFVMLRETARLRPDRLPMLRSRAAELFQAMLRPENAHAVPPLDLVAIAEDNAALLPQGKEGAALAPLLADGLVALDLPRRAAPLLEKLMKAATGTARATYGARLAQVRLEEGNPAGAQAALDDSRADGADPALAGQRTLLRARALAGQGHVAEAASLLAGQGSAAADDLRARLLAGAKDWPGAEAALRALAARSLLAQGSLDEAQRRLLLRLAVAAAEAGDSAELARLRETEAARMQGGRLGDMFRLLVSAPVRGLGDLGRMGAEMALVRTLPQDLKALDGP